MAASSIHGGAKLDAVFSMMAKTLNFVHELSFCSRIGVSVELCICVASYSSLWRLYKAVYTARSTKGRLFVFFVVPVHLRSKVIQRYVTKL